VSKLYEEVADGDHFVIPEGGLNVACCDCGLVHRWSVVGGGSVRLRVKIMGRATGQVRRWMKRQKLGIFGGPSGKPRSQ